MLNPYLLPILLVLLFLAAAVRRVPVYRAFCKGAGDALPLAASLFPYLCAVLIMSELMALSGLTDLLAAACEPFFSLLGIPKELSPLLLLKPFSGSASLASLSAITETYGTQSEIARCAAVIYGSSETVFYVTAVYFSGTGKRRFFLPVALSLAIGIAASAFGCALIRAGL